METGFEYERRQIGKALEGGGATFLMQIQGEDSAATKWMVVTREQVEVLRDTIFPDGIFVNL